MRDAQSASLAALKAYPNVHVVQLDVSSESSIRASVKEVERYTQRVDVLINNAGIYGDLTAADPRTVTAEQFQQVFTTNVVGVLLTTQAYLPLLRQSSATGGAKVINMSSSLGSNACANLFRLPHCVVRSVQGRAQLPHHRLPLTPSPPSPSCRSTPAGCRPTWATQWAQRPRSSPTRCRPCATTIAEKGIQHTGDYIDTMTGNLIVY